MVKSYGILYFTIYSNQTVEHAYYMISGLIIITYENKIHII